MITLLINEAKKVAEDEILKHIKMSERVSKQLKLASKIENKKEGELIGMLIGNYLDKVYKKNLKSSTKKEIKAIKDGTAIVSDLDGNSFPIKEIM